MEIGATSWGQQWTPPAYEGRTPGAQGNGSAVSDLGGVDPSSRGTQIGSPAFEARGVGATGRMDASGKSDGSDATTGIGGSKECKTCKARKYSDRSSDPTVSFQTPTSLSPEAASVAVRAHEQQHVVHEQARARESGLRVVSQNVTIHSAICPECGRSYVSGGTTTTTTRSAGGSSYTSSGVSGASSAGSLVNRLA